MISFTGPLHGNDPFERFLHRLDKFAPLDNAARDALRRAVQRGPLVSSEHELQIDASTDVTIVLSGWVCHFRLLDNGRRQITSIVVPGDFADFGFLSGRTTHTQSVATSRSQLGRIRLRQFADLTEQYPNIMKAALHAAAAEAAISRERVITLGVRSALERVAHLLCEFYHRLSAVDLVSSTGTYDLPMTQAELGDALGLSTVHVNRTVQVLRRRGIISIQNGKATIHDLGQLADLAGFDPSYLDNAKPSDETLFA